MRILRSWGQRPIQGLNVVAVMSAITVVTPEAKTEPSSPPRRRALETSTDRVRRAHRHMTVNPAQPSVADQAVDEPAGPVPLP